MSEEFHRYKKQNIIINGLITLAFGLLPGFAFLVVKAVDLSGISIFANYYVVAMTSLLYFIHRFVKAIPRLWKFAYWKVKDEN